jgi:hypothetical protein
VQIEEQGYQGVLGQMEGTSSGGCHMGGRAYIAAPRIDVA